jgi:hypothetical protein
MGLTGSGLGLYSPLESDGVALGDRHRELEHVAARLEQCAHNATEESVDDLIATAPRARDRNIREDRPRGVLGETVADGIDVASNERVEVALQNLFGWCVVGHDRCPATKARTAAATSAGRSRWARAGSIDRDNPAVFGKRGHFLWHAKGNCLVESAVHVDDRRYELGQPGSRVVAHLLCEQHSDVRRGVEDLSGGPRA